MKLVISALTLILLSFNISSSQINAIQRELQANARRLRATPHALIHRDWQSSNILFRGPHPVMIDYQGMRRGPIAYDLASLLCDPYINLPPARQRHLLTHYTTQHPQGPQIAAAYPFAAIQRLTQTLGAYATLSRRPHGTGSTLRPEQTRTVYR